MFTYKSHQKASNRAFDHLYDPNFSSNNRKMQQMNSQAICKTAPLHIIPCFYSMFSEIRRSEFYFPQRNGLPYNSNDCEPKTIDKRPKNHHLYSVQTSLSNEFRFSIKHPEIKSLKINSHCQTIYRETEIQTDSYLPQPTLKLYEKAIPEILCVDCNDTPDLEDIKKIERDRLRKQWESDLKELPLSLEEKINQLEIFEWQSYFLREKEFNDLQQKRMDYVINTLEQREQKRVKTCKEKLQNVYKTVSMEKIKAQENFEIKAQRKLRKLSNLNGSKIDIAIPKILRKVKSLNLNRLTNFKIENNEKTKIEKVTKKPLWNPKQKPKEFEHAMKSEKTLNDIYDAIKFHNNNIEKQHKQPRCKKINIIEDYPAYECSDDQELYDSQNKAVIIQKLLKGAFVQRSLVSGMKENIYEINKLRRKLPLNCVIEMFGEENWRSDLNLDNLDENETIDNIEEVINEIIVEEHPLKEDSPGHLNIEACASEAQNLITDVLHKALLIAQDVINRKVLKEANDERLKREEIAKIEALRQKIVNMKKELIKRKFENFCANTVNEIIQMIIPLVIEEISAKEALDFVMKKAAEISAVACNKDVSNTVKIEKFLNEILLPHIESKSDGSDEHLVALYGSFDAFNSFVEKYFSSHQ